ncbi:glycoside hydrolase family 68 protein [Altererythrobacter salegens]|uniref:Glycoside hydrolase family 68 protein n=1 Tax=Croceibacterium salegens TaxID=1737568 RepID=A0A6I4SVI3_9SPHN|nr:glycoside hydrolase family 68 protein [Croceibacterium salegens]MXO59951.1 glycoside hydrolase family 68 protein [Croceibacterium salegens]
MPLASAPRIEAGDITRIADDLDIWDAWPIQRPDGMPAVLPDGSSLWMALGAPRDPDPDKRHDKARIHLLQLQDRGWLHLGPAMPEGFSPGSREWSGSAVLVAESGEVTLYFTATGTRGEAQASFLQRIFRARATLDLVRGQPRIDGWHDLQEIVRPDPAHYMASDAGTGAIGTIKAFRDPAYFLDPADGASYLFFAASAARSKSDFNGIVGAAVAEGEGLAEWRIVPPVISADGLNNELERPHAVCRDGHYYLFWSTQRHVFDASGPTGPTGLYGVVGARLSGPWEPLNGTGLVFANPSVAPRQAYSWLVLPSLEVISFVDDWRSPDGPPDVRRFGGTFAPVLRLVLDGAKAELVT